jgi:flagellar protein FlbT
MPLKLTLAAGERLIVNGAVIRNDGADAHLVFENRAQIMRQRDILTLETATTPAARIYLALQCAYLFPDRQADHLADFHRLLDEFAGAVPSAGPLVEELRGISDHGQLYNALKVCKRLIEYETGVLEYVQV